MFNNLFESFNKSFALVVALVVFSFGIFASLMKVLNENFNSSSGNIIADILLNFPTWMGTFLGVLVGAFLAYEFSRKKHEEDEFRKSCLQLNKFLEQLCDAITYTDMLQRHCSFAINQLNESGKKHIARSLGFTVRVDQPKQIELSVLDFPDLDIDKLNTVYKFTKSYNGFVEMQNSSNEQLKQISDDVYRFSIDKKIKIDTTNDFLQTVLSKHFITEHTPVFINTYCYFKNDLLNNLVELNKKAREVIQFCLYCKEYIKEKETNFPCKPSKEFVIALPKLSALDSEDFVIPEITREDAQSQMSHVNQMNATLKREPIKAKSLIKKILNN